MPVLLYVAGVVAHNDLNQWKKGGFETCVTKAEFSGVGTFFTNRFPSLGIFVNNKVGI